MSLKIPTGLFLPVPFTATMTSNHFSSADFSIGQGRRVCYATMVQGMKGSYTLQRWHKASPGVSLFDVAAVFSDCKNVVLPKLLRSSQSFPERRLFFWQGEGSVTACNKSPLE